MEIQPTKRLGLTRIKRALIYGLNKFITIVSLSLFPRKMRTCSKKNEERQELFHFIYKIMILCAQKIRFIQVLWNSIHFFHILSSTYGHILSCAHCLTRKNILVRYSVSSPPLKKVYKKLTWPLGLSDSIFELLNSIYSLLKVNC